MNQKSIDDNAQLKSDDVKAKNNPIVRSGYRLGLAGLLIAGAATLYGILPRDPGFYDLNRGNTPSGRYIVPKESRISEENQIKAAGVATGAGFVMISGFALALYGIGKRVNNPTETQYSNTNIQTLANPTQTI